MRKFLLLTVIIFTPLIILDLPILLSLWHPPLQYGGIYKGMALTEFQVSLPDATLASKLSADGMLFHRPTAVGSERYVFFDNKLAGFVISWNDPSAFEATVAKISAANGDPEQAITLMGTRAVMWRSGNTMLQLIKPGKMKKMPLPFVVPEEAQATNALLLTLSPSAS